MGRLKNYRVYLSGAIDRVKDEGTPWRNEISKWLKNRGINPINPHDKPFEIGFDDKEAREDIEKLKKEGNFTAIHDRYKTIRSVDLHCVDVSDVLIVRLDAEVFGTTEELVTANRQMKPILTYHAKGLSAIQNWCFFMLPPWCLFQDLEHIKKYIKYIDTTDNLVLSSSESKRWKFWKSGFIDQ